jgi:endonuclease/exonuclease/phosphatase family metal-dependent hydrolase
MRVLVWNMQGKTENWAKLAELDADVALLCEARVADYPSSDHIAGESTTVGLDFERRWSTAIVSRHELSEVTDAKASRRGNPIDIPFGPSRPGSWTAASVGRESLEDLTVVSLYGLMDEKSDASMHRSLSELTPIFEDDRYRHRLLIGGDFNVLAAPSPKDPALARHVLVIERMKAFGLVDCLELRRPYGPLDGCRCGLGNDCRHTWTKFDPQRPTVAYQDDYLFASRSLAGALDSCMAYDPHEWASISDHAPIVAEFNI